MKQLREYETKLYALKDYVKEELGVDIDDAVLGAIMGWLDKYEEDETPISNCCGAEMSPDTGICPECKEHCGVEYI